MKLLILFTIISFTFSSWTQTLYDFSSDPLTNGWSYYDTYSTSPEFEYNATSERIDYDIYTSTDISILHRQLPVTLSENYCVSFQITPTNSSNYNTFFPLILTPFEITSPGVHPWRQNATSPSSAGGMQNLDFLAIEVFSNQIRFFSRNNNIGGANLIHPFSPPFYMAVNNHYWVELIISDYTTAEITVYDDAGFTSAIASASYTIPLLDDMNHLYIANSNGNSGCTQEGYLDDYHINYCNSPSDPITEINSPETLNIDVDIDDTDSTSVDFYPTIIPNVFSPNNDQINDFFEYHFTNDDDFIRILNRWGFVITELNTLNPTWDGKWNGNNCVEGVYFYQAQINGESKQGFITLVK